MERTTTVGHVYTSIDGCDCKESWAVQGYVPCETSCCAPDGDEKLWCICEEASSKVWGYCDLSDLNISQVEDLRNEQISPKLEVQYFNFDTEGSTGAPSIYPTTSDDEVLPNKSGSHATTSSTFSRSTTIIVSIIISIGLVTIIMIGVIITRLYKKDHHWRSKTEPRELSIVKYQNDSA